MPLKSVHKSGFVHKSGVHKSGDALYHIVDTKFKWEFFSEFVFFALRKRWVVGGSESDARRLARSPLIGRLSKFYPGASARANAWPNTDLAPKKIQQKYSKDSASVSWWSKESSDAEGKLLKFVKVMIEKWFDHHFSSFFQGYSLRHKKISLDLGGRSKDLTKFHQNFFRKS